MPAPIMFLDLAGPDDEALSAFYKTVFDWQTGSGPYFTPGNAANLDMTIRKDPAEKVFYIGVQDITATLELVEQAGGKIDMPRFEAPGTAVLGLFFDPAGNRMGLVELKGDTLVVP